MVPETMALIQKPRGAWAVPLGTLEVQGVFRQAGVQKKRHGPGVSSVCCWTLSCLDPEGRYDSSTGTLAIEDLYIHIYIYIHIHISMLIYIHIYIYVCRERKRHIHAYTSICIYIYIYIYVRMCLFVF